MSTLKNLNNTHLTDEQLEAVYTALTNLEAALAPAVTNLNSEERRKYGSVSEQNKLFINKVHDYSLNQPSLRTPDVDWDEFNRDMNSRLLIEGFNARLQNLINGLTNSKVLHDYDNYQAALDDYSFTNYKAGTSASGFEAKQTDLKQFFAKTKKTEEVQEEPVEETDV